MDDTEKKIINRTGDYLIIPADMTLEEISRYQHTPKILKKAIHMSEDTSEKLGDALRKEPYLMPVFVLADGMIERNKGDWSIKVDNRAEIKGDSNIRIDLYGLESYIYEVKEGNDDEKWILAGAATVQNANVPDWRVVLGKSDGDIFRDKKLEGMIQGQRIQDAKNRRGKVSEAYSKAIGEEGKNWLGLLEEFLKKSGL